MKRSEIIVGHTYTNGKSASAEVMREVIAVSYGKVDVKYKVVYANCIPDDYGTFTCLCSTFARWAKIDLDKGATSAPSSVAPTALSASAPD